MSTSVEVYLSNMTTMLPDDSWRRDFNDRIREFPVPGPDDSIRGQYDPNNVCAFICETFFKDNGVDDQLRDNPIRHLFDEYWYENPFNQPGRPNYRGPSMPEIRPEDRELAPAGDGPPEPRTREQIQDAQDMILRYCKYMKKWFNRRIIDNRRKKLKNGQPKTPKENMPLWEDDFIRYMWERARRYRPVGAPPLPGIPPFDPSNPRWEQQIPFGDVDNLELTDCRSIFVLIWEIWISCVQDFTFWYQRRPQSDVILEGGDVLPPGPPNHSPSFPPGFVGPNTPERTWPPQRVGPNSDFGGCMCCPNPNVFPDMVNPARSPEDRERLREQGRPAT